MIAGIAGRDCGTLVDTGLAPTSIGRVTVTAGGGAGCGAGAGLGGGGGPACEGGAGAGGWGLAAGGRCGAGAPGRATCCGSGRAGTAPAFPEFPFASVAAFAPRPSLPGAGLRPSFGDRFIGGPSSPALEGAGDDEDSASPFALGKSFEKMLIAEDENRRISSGQIKPAGRALCDRVYIAAPRAHRPRPACAGARGVPGARRLQRGCYGPARSAAWTTMPGAFGL